MRKNLLLGIAFLSGVAALIHETVWQKYFSILLGAQARATALVLAVFLAGMSVGYFVFGKAARRSKNPFRLCAGIEVLLAVWALAFPFFFHFAFGSLGTLHSIGLSSGMIDITLSFLMMALPSVLFGATLPLLTHGASLFPGDVRPIHASLYGWNTVGAALGSLLTGYVLIPATSFPAALRVGSLLNGIAGLLLFYYFRISAKSFEKPRALKWDLKTNEWLLIGHAGLSGFAILTLETVLIRLVGLSTGASQYNFTLILSLVIFALGIGSLVMARFSRVTFRHLLWNQFFAVLSLIVLYYTVDYWPYWVHLVRIEFSAIPQAFYFYQVALFFLFTFLIVPLVFCGLTLPISFSLLRQNGRAAGEEVGLLYGVNTVGTVAGAFLGGYFLLNFWNLDLLFKFCAWLLLFGWVGFLCLFYLQKEIGRWRMAGLGFLSIVLSFVLLLLPEFDRDGFIQPFRRQEKGTASFQGLKAFQKELSHSLRLVMWEDGPNTSVGIGRFPLDPKEPEVSRTLLVNGKSDGNTKGDALTTLLLGHLPALLTPSISRVNVIGFGTGMTAGALAQYAEVKKIEVAEISGTIIRHADKFDEYDGFASKNGKISLYENDAFRLLSQSRDRYDIIVSEPSNPWVLGVENLYSREFYRIAKNRLAPEGSFAQWIHTYSFGDDLFKRVLATLSDVFPAVDVFQLGPHDYLLLARHSEIPDSQLEVMRRRMKEKSVALNLNYIMIDSPEKLLGRQLMSTKVVRELSKGAVLHTLESPRLSQEAARAFFSGSFSNPHALKRQAKSYVGFSESSLLSRYLNGKAPSPELLTQLYASFCDSPPTSNISLCEEVSFVSYAYPQLEFSKFRKPSDRAIASLRSVRKPSAGKFTEKGLIDLYNSYEEYKKFRSPVSRLPASFFMAPLDRCLNTVEYRSDLYGECLLQKILVADNFDSEKIHYLPLSQKFLDWMKRYPKNREKFSRFDNARQLLSEIVELRER